MTSLDISVAEGAQLLLETSELESLAAAVLEHEGVERDCSVSLSFVDDERIRELNLEWRGVDAPTDVLSFELEGPDDPDLSPDACAELGDIVLASPYVCAQAASFGTSVADETRLLFVHGMLHLLGYDHEDDEEAAAMQAAEEDILASVPNDGTLTDVVLARHREEQP